MIASAYWRSIDWEAVRVFVSFVVICYVVFWLPLKWWSKELDKILDEFFGS